MNPYAIGPLFVVVALLQSTVTSQVRILGASPDLTLMLAVACVLQWGVRESLAMVLVGGLMVDILTGAPFGCATLALVLISTLVGIGEVNVPRSVKILPYAAVAVGTIAYQLIWLVLLQLWGRTVLWGPMLLRETLPSVLVNTLFMPLMYVVVRALNRHAPDEPVI
jgi:rod shape-determining protein MreD